MKNLNYGCRRSDFLVTNSNDDWFIQCRFYEPDRDKPFTYRRRLNKFKNETERKSIEKKLLKHMTAELDDRDYNPRTKRYMFLSDELNPDLSVKDSLEKALEGKSYVKEHYKICKSYINNFLLHLDKINLGYLKIKDIELLHVKKGIEACGLSNYSFNKYKKVLSSLFTDLVDAGCLKVNPCTGMKSKKHVVDTKDIFTDEELETISDLILRTIPNFYNFYQIFYMSGCRVPEMMGLRKSDVNIEKSEFTIMLKKGDLYIREKRAIIPDALMFWKDQLLKSKPNDYLFSSGFIPGPKLIDRDFVYKFWKRNIGIKTIYTLKHTFLDKVEAANYSAQIMAGHRKDSTTAIYTVGRERRRLEAQKQISIK